MAPPKGHILHIGRAMRCIYSTSLQSAKCDVRMDAHGLLPTLSPAVAIFIFSGISAAQSLFTIRKSCIQRHPYFYSSSDKPVTDKTTVKAAALFSALQMNVTVMPHIKIWAVLRKIKYRKKCSCQEWRVDIIHIKISQKKKCALEYKKLKEKKGQEILSFRCSWVTQQHVSALCPTVRYAMVLSSQKGEGGVFKNKFNSFYFLSITHSFHSSFL